MPCMTVAFRRWNSTMRVKFECPVCASRLSVRAAALSSQLNCPRCGSRIMTPASGVGPGVILDDFKLLQRIGRGAMGDVYLARQQSLSRQVAVKVLSPGMTSTPGQVERFRTEMRTLARLQHPNIVTAFYAGHSHGVHYLAMSYVGGESIYDRIQRTGYLSEDEALSVVYKVAEALRYAWNAHGLIHRDIKPANIMIDTDGEVKLTDLGISKYVYEETSAAERSSIFGTPHYMSPEQVRGELDIDFRSDMYSLGATLYQMLTGRPPFEAESIEAIMECQLREPPPPVRDARPDLSRGGEQILLTLLAKNRDGRYDSWSDLLAVVHRTLSDQMPMHIAATPPAVTAEQVIKRDRRRTLRRRFVLIPLLIGLAAFIGVRGWDLYLQEREYELLAGTVHEAIGDHQAPPDKLRKAIGALRDRMHRAEHVGDRERFGLLMQRAKREQERRVREVVDFLDHRALPFIEAGQGREAAAVYLNYDGPWAEESAEARTVRAEGLIAASEPRARSAVNTDF